MREPCLTERKREENKDGGSRLGTCLRWVELGLWHVNVSPPSLPAWRGRGGGDHSPIGFGNRATREGQVRATRSSQSAAVGGGDARGMQAGRLPYFSSLLKTATPAVLGVSDQLRSGSGHRPRQGMRFHAARLSTALIKERELREVKHRS